MTEAFLDFLLALVFCRVLGAPWWAAVILFFLLRLMSRAKKINDLLNDLIHGIWSAQDGDLVPFERGDGTQRLRIVRDCTRESGHDGACNGWQTASCLVPPEAS